MDRPVWSGSIGFGIVTIPVQMFTAVRDHDIHFHQISRSDRKRIRYLKVSEGSTEEVPAGDIVKGYEVEDGQYVVFDEAELTALSARKSKIIDIAEFVPLASIDPLFFDRPYFLRPLEAGLKPYRLLVEALTAADRVGVAQMVMHGKEHVVAVRSLNAALVVQLLRFADEVLAPEPVDGHAAPKIAAKELAMAGKLVESMAEDFDPAAHRDEYRDRVQQAINRKAKGKTVAIAEDEAPDDGKVIDLMEALERSLSRNGAKKSGANPAKAAASAQKSARKPAPAPALKRSRRAG